MTRFQRRLFVTIDEWLGAGVCLYLWRMHDSAFWYVFAVWILLIYAVSYPLYWWENRIDNDAEFAKKVVPLRH